MVSYSITLDLDLDPRTDAEIAADRIGPGTLAAVVGPPLPQPPKKRARESTWEEEFKAHSTSAERKAWAEENRPDRLTPEQDEWKARAKARNLEWWADLRADPAAFEVYRAKLSAAVKVAMATPAEKARQKAEMKMRWADLVYRAEVLATLAKPASRAKKSVASKKSWADPAYRAKQSAVMKAHWTDPVYRAKISAANRSRTVSPETRAKISAAMKVANLGRKHTPETRAKISAAVKAARTPEHRAEQAERARTRAATQEG